jgi:hypothetical protein
VAVRDSDELIPFGEFADGTAACHDFDKYGALTVYGVMPEQRAATLATIVNGGRVRDYEGFYLSTRPEETKVHGLLANGVRASASLDELPVLAEDAAELLAERRKQFALEGWNSFAEAHAVADMSRVVYAIDGWEGIAATLHSNDPLTLRENEFRRRTAQASIELYRFGAPYGIHVIMSQFTRLPDSTGASLTIERPGVGAYENQRDEPATVTLWERD